MVVLLVAAAIASFAFGQPKEGIAVLVVIALNAVIGFATELRAWAPETTQVRLVLWG